MTFDIIIATQKIFDFSNFYPDLSAVIQIDNVINLPDYNTTENVFQTIMKLNDITNKQILIQTYNPENFLWQNIQRPERILHYIYHERKTYNYPPFTQLIKLIYQHQNEEKCQNEAQKLTDELKENNFHFLGPNPCFIPKIRNKYRYQIVIKLPLKNLYWKKKLMQMKNIDKWSVDVDPITLL